MTSRSMMYIRSFTPLFPHRPSISLRPHRLHLVLLRKASSAPSRKPVSGASLLSQALDQKQRSSRGEDNVGPFRLGLIPPTPQDVGGVKKWSQLSTGGKVLRSTARTSNLAVILFGAGLSAVLLYALTSELFSKNSPTVLHGQACQLIKESPRVARFLQGPLTFHNNPPTAIRPRHRNHHVSSQIAVDSSGKEHMLLNFYIQGRPPGSAPMIESDSYFDRVVTWSRATVIEASDMTFDELVDVIKERADGAFESCKRIFRFLSGDSVPSPQPPPLQSLEVQEEKQESGWVSSVAGLFSGIRSSSKASADANPDSSYAPSDTEGEVHADLVMNRQGYFEFRYLLIDIPDSHARNPKRVFVIRSDGVRDSERVMRWHK